ncbi:KEOPS complex subunit Pcc1 [Candidatus Nanohalococcus occultus]|uniref:KEOPS complex subunit Pcc1 n=1 Tax=Candidatus Nanohalococcus occultus TaxID=2978047 RepID=UPI0039DFCAA2
MKSSLEIDSANAETIATALKPSLETDDNVEYTVKTENGLEITSRTDTLGRLRGVTDNALRMSLLANKILQR